MDSRLKESAADGTVSRSESAAGQSDAVSVSPRWMHAYGGIPTQFTISSGSGPSWEVPYQVSSNFPTHMRSEWNQIIRQERDYLEAYQQWLELQKTIAAARKPAPPLEEEDVAAKLVNNWLIGCDPEFVVLGDRGGVVNVEGTLPHNGEAGWDHSGDVIEIRPEPAHGTYKLLQRMQKIILHNENLERLKS